MEPAVVIIQMWNLQPLFERSVPQVPDKSQDSGANGIRELEQRDSGTRGCSLVVVITNLESLDQIAGLCLGNTHAQTILSLCHRCQVRARRPGTMI